eukprot:scaffold2107_cov192-Alexandrium_tamarense.AAC.3
MGGYLYKSPATSQRAHYQFFAIELLLVPPDVTTSTFNTNDCTMRHHRLSGKNPIPASSTSLPVKIKVAVGEGEPIESALRRFKREVNKSGHLMDLRHKRYFENSQDRKKRKIVQARIRKRLERMQARRLRQQRS